MRDCIDTVIKGGDRRSKRSGSSMPWKIENKNLSIRRKGLNQLIPVRGTAKQAMNEQVSRRSSCASDLNIAFHLAKRLANSHM
jgi:hypothetical protein